MTHITERERIQLVHSLETAIGQQAAVTLMEYLPATGWRDVATITDLDNLRLDLTTEFRTGLADLRTELKTEMAGLRTELKTEMAGLCTELKTEMAGLRTELKTDMASLTRTMVLTFVTTLIAFGGLIVAAAAIYKP